MTCYETLRVPAPAADAPMAHHFVKWWRNKFRNGYKKFSIGMEGERTDTEELMGRAASQCSAPPDLLPSEARALLQPATPPPRRAHPQTPSPTQEEKPRLRFEELTCDVELQHPQPSKQQPLQFSFTLYDLDGHGRMTKDDIAGIVSTIYESIGKSVTVPHYGSKTIQVRLTVVPEDGSSRARRARGEARRRRQRAPAEPSDDEQREEQRDRFSPDDDASSKSSSSDRPPPPRAQDRHQRHHRHSRKEHRERKHTKKRSGSLQRRELLEIIQANMEKNHMNFQTSRKPREPTVEEEITSKYQKMRNRSYTVSGKPLPHTFQKKAESTGNGYLDLAGAGGGGAGVAGGEGHLCRYDRYLHAVICSSAKHANSGYHQKQQAPRPRAPPARPRHDPPHNNSAAHPKILQIIFL
ncbi:protein naked cuticle homolog [Plutella xylostella]|uniref:protein naked cuticle homolog n=1 Tax=Plutella xylostella TaxID=51655 RepID=UPI0020329E4E|nr:protein naked cuticle homolog [Plutella xylostella]